MCIVHAPSCYASLTLCSSREAAGPMLLAAPTPPQHEPQPAAKAGGSKRRQAPSTDSDEEDAALLLAQMAAAPAAGAAPSGQRRSQRHGAGALMGALIAEVEGGAEEATARALPPRQAALSSPSGSRRRLQLVARHFEEWAQPSAEAAAVAASIPEDEGAGDAVGWRAGALESMGQHVLQSAEEPAEMQAIWLGITLVMAAISTRCCLASKC